MGRLPRWALVATSSAALVVASVGVAISVSRSGTDRVVTPPATLERAKGEEPLPSGAQLTADAAKGLESASVVLAAELASPQHVANAFAFTQGMAKLEPEG